MHGITLLHLFVLIILMTTLILTKQTKQLEINTYLIFIQIYYLKKRYMGKA
jgi:hypothetical protein